MGTTDRFLAQFAASPEDSLAPTQDPLATFLDRFSGPKRESFFFYEGTVEIQFDPVDHIYYLVGSLGELTALLNVSTVAHIVDRSEALIPWAAKMTVEKLLRIIPTQLLMTGPDDPCPLVFVPSMSLVEFTKIALEAKSAHKDKLEDAGEVGHMAHAYIEQRIKCILSGAVNTTAMPEEPRAKNCVIAELGWETAHNVRWLATEKKVYSKIHNCSGTMDGLAMVDSCSDPTCCKASFKDHLSLIDHKTSNYLYIEFLFQTAAYKGFHLEEFPDVKIEDIWILRYGKEDAEWDPWFLPSECFEDDYKGFLACLELKRIVIAANERLKEQKAGIRAAKKTARESAREIAKAQEKVDKAVKKAEARLAKQEEKARVKAEAKRNREADKAAAKKIKEETKRTKVVVICNGDPSPEEKPSEWLKPIEESEAKSPALVKAIEEYKRIDALPLCVEKIKDGIDSGMKVIEAYINQDVESGLQKAARDYPEYTIHIPMEEN